MAKRQGDGQRPGESAPAPERRGADPLALATLAGVAAVLVLSLASWRGVDRIDRSLGERLGKLETRLEQVATRMERASAQAPQRGPDPNRVYTIQTASAPARGPIGAPVTIAEFSDFQ
jgi:type II secretory pathway component PulM